MKSMVLIVFSASILVCAALVAYALPQYSQEVPLLPPYYAEIQPRMWFPQGWQFFTKSPRDERFDAFGFESPHEKLIDNKSLNSKEKRCLGTL